MVCAAPAEESASSVSIPTAFTPSFIDFPPKVWIFWLAA
jgi:hypothetical protein